MDPDKPLEGVRLLALQVIPFPEPEPWLLSGPPSPGEVHSPTFGKMVLLTPSSAECVLGVVFSRTVQSSSLVCRSRSPEHL